jgi:hypothetical protein
MSDPVIEPTCPRCGGDKEWNECEACGGEGIDGHDCGEDSCCCADPEENVTCSTCFGQGGWWACGFYPPYGPDRELIARAPEMAERIDKLESALRAVEFRGFESQSDGSCPACCHHRDHAHDCIVGNALKP